MEETQTGAKFTLHLSHQYIEFFELHTFQMQSPILIRANFLQNAILFYKRISIDVGRYQLSKWTALSASLWYLSNEDVLVSKLRKIAQKKQKQLRRVSGKTVDGVNST